MLDRLGDNCGKFDTADGQGKQALKPDESRS
jgi:hypothetical protein